MTERMVRGQCRFCEDYITCDYDGNLLDEYNNPKEGYMNFVYTYQSYYKLYNFIYLST